MDEVSINWKIGFSNDILHPVSNIPLGELSITLNDGTDKMPPRPFFVDFYEMYKDIIDNRIKVALNKYLQYGNLQSLKNELKILGDDMTNGLRAIIESNNYADTAPSTKAKKKGKGSMHIEDILQDTEFLKNNISVVFEII
jgi:hypothetical protein